MYFGIFETLALACFVLLLGYYLVRKVAFFKNFNVPEPVVGGFVVAILMTLLYYVWGFSFSFEESLQKTMMLIFFSSIGLSADFSRLLKGGKPLIIFLGVTALFIILQNIFGISLASLLGISPAYGLIAGSVTLTGGHGTGIAYAETLTSKFGISGASELAMACATFGLVAGGILGGPVARFLLKKSNTPEMEDDDARDAFHEPFEQPQDQRKINVKSVIETLAMMACCLLIGQFLDRWATNTPYQLPTFVWCLFIGVIIRNTLSHLFRFKIADRSIDVLGSVGLSLFLAIALMSLQLWQLAGLALPVFVILVLQVALMAVFAIFVTYKVMGKNYDAIVLSAGHCGFGLGATPTAVANMQAITNRFGPSHKAFLIVPMVGAFFIDLINTLILKGFMEFLVLVK